MTVEKPWDAARRLLGTVRNRAAVTARLREISPLDRWRDRSLLDLLGLNRDVLLQALKIAISAGVSWALAQKLLGSPSPIWAPITASLIALLTVQASVRDAVQRIIAVVLGMVVALWLGSLIGLHAWSISIIVALGFLVGKMLRLIPAAAAQIPITGLFILALGSGQSVQRVLDTLIGAAVAVIVNLVIAPPNHVTAARRAIQELADEVVDVLSDMANGISRPWRREQAASWLRTARSHASLATGADSAADQAAESLHLHPGRASWTGALGAVRQANRTLHTVEIQVRVLARTLRDISEDLAAEDGLQMPLPMAADMLTTTAGAIAAFSDEVLASEPPGRRGDDGPDTDRAARDGPAGRDWDAAARASISRARDAIEAITVDLKDMVAANLARGIYLGTLVVETGRILDELAGGLDAMAAQRAEPAR